MDRKFAEQRIVDVLVLGILLWLMGYVGSIILFPFIPKSMLGWILCAIFTPVTIVIACYRFRNRKLKFFCYFMTGVIWVVIAAVMDYFFIVRMFNADYYKPDVFVYYLITLLIPAVIGLINTRKSAR